MRQQLQCTPDFERAMTARSESAGRSNAHPRARTATECDGFGCYFNDWGTRLALMRSLKAAGRSVSRFRRVAKLTTSKTRW